MKLLKQVNILIIILFFISFIGFSFSFGASYDQEVYEAQHPQFAKINDPKPKDTPPTNKSRFTKNANGVVKDGKTGLEWFAGPDMGISRQHAKLWVEGLNVDGGGGWRRPTIAELKTLYQKGKGCCNMTPLLKTGGWYVWSSDIIDSWPGWYFDFFYGHKSRFWSLQHFAISRAFAVRSQQKRLEAEKQKPETAKLSPTPSLKEIARDGHFIAYDDGTVKDTRTGLMWASKDNGRDVTWEEAKEYCENYRGGGYTDWRMPTQDDLARIYDYNKSYRPKQLSYNIHLTELIQLSTCCLWGSETRTHGSLIVFDFGVGSRGWLIQSRSFYVRALPVRYYW